MVEPHVARVERITRRFDEAMRRFIARLESAGGLSDQPPPDGGWSPAQIAMHVAKVNGAFAGLISGALPGPQPVAQGFVERDWSEVAAGVATKLTASGRFVPPAGVRMADALRELRRSGDAVRAALASLTEERGRGYSITSSIVGEISVYQIGEWATAHVIRHNAQAKRVPGRPT